MKKNILIFIFLVGPCYCFSQWTTNGTNVYVTNTSYNVGIGTTTAGNKLTVNGNASIGDGFDGTSYGLLQLVRPGNQGDNRFHLSFIRMGNSVSGMGYAPNSNILGIWHSNNNSGNPLLSFTPDQKVGIGTATPAEKFTIAGDDGNINIGSLNFPGYNGIWLNGGTAASDYNFLSKASDKNLYINRPNGAEIHFRQQNNTQVLIGSSGNVAIGGQPAEYRLDILTNAVNDGILMRNNGGGWIKFSPNNASVGAYNQITQAGDAGIIYGTASQPTGSNVTYGFVIAPWHGSKTGIRIDKEGNVGIGTNNTSDLNYKLFVETGIRTRKVRVDQATWADYVFDNDYRLRTIEEIERFIQQHKHLPEVPTAKEVEKEGIDLGENQTLLLKKIEELTLYVIDQQKQIDELRRLVKSGTPSLNKK